MQCLVVLALVPAWSFITYAEQLPIRVYGTADGLSRDQINRIVRDSRGFLWFCTPEGLSRYDGYEFKNYTTADGLPHRSVRDLLETRDGVYWIATGDGLCRFNPTGHRPLTGSEIQNQKSKIRKASGPLFTVYHPGESLATRSVTAVFEDHAGTVWVGTESGLYRLEEPDGQVRFIFLDLGMSTGRPVDTAVFAALEDRRGALWVSSSGGLYHRRPDGRTERYTARHGLPESGVRALLEDRDGRLWVGTTKGLCLLVSEPNQNRSVVARVFTTREGLASNWINSLFQSSDGKLWVGGASGLSEFLPEVNDRAFRTYATAQGLSDPAIEALAQDRDGNLWIGTGSGGAMKLSRSGFTTYDEVAELASLGGVASILENRAGELCVTNKQLIYRFDGKRFIRTRLDLPSHITSFGWGWHQVAFEDHAGEWWVPTGQGLCRFPKVSRVEDLSFVPPKAVYTSRDGLLNDEVFRVFEDSRGDIWIGTTSYRDPSGLTRWERATETFHRYLGADGLPPLWATAFCEDASGNLWIGTGGTGLVRYRAGRFTLFTTADGLPANWIGGLYLDHAGRLWVATDPGGLGRLDHPNEDRPRFVTYTTTNGLSSHQTWCITEDRWGRIYIGTGRGVDRLNPETGQIKHYSAADGLARGSPVVAFRDRHGTLWFGTKQGLSRLVPEPDPGPSRPSVWISGLRIVGEPYLLSELGEADVPRVTLEPNENQLQIDFVAIGFRVGDVLRYQYKLEGADREWNAVTDQRTVNYAKLSPGSYRFLVRAVNTEGMASSTPASVAFTLLAPIWQRWWFLTMAATLFGALVYVAYRYRLARLVELERVRTRIASDLHDDVGTALSQIAILGEVLKHQGPIPHQDYVQILTQIADTARTSVDTMSDIVWSIDPRRDDLNSLIVRIGRYAATVFSAKGIAWDFQTPPSLEKIKLTPEQRRHLYLILKEAISNIARHSGGASALLSMRVVDRSLNVEIRDDGCGLAGDSIADELQPAGGGHGLMNMRSRATQLGGRLEVLSEKRRGTTIKLTVPL